MGHHNNHILSLCLPTLAKEDIHHVDLAVSYNMELPSPIEDFLLTPTRAGSEN